MDTWASRTNPTLGAVSAIQSGLTVRLAMTDRARLMTCRPSDTMDAIARQNVEQFSVLPVEVDGRICGLYRADRWFDRSGNAPCRPVGDDYERLTEQHLIGSDASLLGFLAEAIEHSERLVVSGSEVVGLVCLADIQKLPVRAAMFSAITALELAMANRIETAWVDDPNGWLDELSSGRQAKIEEAADEARETDMFVSYLILSQLADKATVIRKKRMVPGTQKALRRDFESIIQLRHWLAHANPYGRTPPAAQEVCRTVVTALRLLEQL